MNNLTVDQLKELLQIQKEFDSRIPTLNLQDSKIAYVVEFFEWFNTLETFKNWKKRPGKPLDVQLDELADMLAFGLSIANQEDIDTNMEEAILYVLSQDKSVIKQFNFEDKNETQEIILDLPSSIFQNDEVSKVLAVSIPFKIAVQYYSIDQLIAAYKKKMERNHARQDGTADTEKGYV